MPKKVQTVGDFLKEHRKRKGVSIREMADDLGLNHIHICRLEGGHHHPRKATLKAILDYLEVSKKERRRLAEIMANEILKEIT